MSTDSNGKHYRIHLLATACCGLIALAGVIAETVCRLNRIEVPLSFSTLVGVCIGALAGAVPTYTQPDPAHKS